MTGSLGFIAWRQFVHRLLTGGGQTGNTPYLRRFDREVGAEMNTNKTSQKG